MRARFALLAVAVMAAQGALAQLKLSDDLPKLPAGAAACNESRTHCLVNFEDWMASEVAVQIAGARLAIQEEQLERREREVKQLRTQLEILARTKACAIVTPDPPGGARKDSSIDFPTTTARKEAPP